MWRLFLIALIGLTPVSDLWAQSTKIDASSQVRNIDFTNASSTRPVKAGTDLPATCVVGELFYKTTAVDGANLYACTSANGWTVLGGIGTGTAGVAPGDSSVIVVTDQSTGEQLVSVNPAAVGTLSGNNDFTGSNRLDVSYLTMRVANDGVSGTEVNRLAMLTSDGTAQTAAVGTTGKILGVVVSGAGTSEMARLAFQGFALCEFDGPTVAGHYVQLSASADGKCTDAGATMPDSGQVLGLAMSTRGGPGAYDVLWIPFGPGFSGGGGDAPPSPSNLKIVEEFVSPLPLSGYLGTHGWSVVTNGSGSGDDVAIVDVPNHMGIVDVHSGTDNEGWAEINIGPPKTYSLLSSTAVLQGTYRLEYVFRIPAALQNGGVRLGVQAEAGPHTTLNGRLALRAITGDTNFVYEACLGDGVSCTTQDSGVPVDTAWHRVRIYRSAGDTNGYVRFCMDACSSSWQATSNVPDRGNPTAVAYNNSSGTASNALQIDWFLLWYEGLNRW